MTGSSQGVSDQAVAPPAQSLFSGMNMSNTSSNQMSMQGHMTGQQTVAPPTQGLFSGMNMTNASNQMSMQGYMTGLTNQGQGHVTGTANQIGTHTPLVPTPVSQRSGMGWSSSIDTGMGINSTQLNQQMGWSSGISQATQSSNWMPQNQMAPAPTAATLMMQGGPLLPQGAGHAPQPHPPPSSTDNPFADLSFLG